MRAIGRILALGLIAASSSCTLILGKFQDEGAGGGSSTSSGSSSSGATTSSSTGSSSGGCGQPPCCAVPSDCPAPPACMDATCTAGACGVTPSAPGPAASSAQAAGDCQQVVCDGSGGATTQPQDTDLPDDGNPCTAGTCVGGVPAFTPIAGTCPGGEVCGDPAGPNAGACVPATCSNGAQDPGETDVDCGGALCPACGWAKACVTDTDCQSGFCVANLCGSFAIAQGLVVPSGIALDAASVYWTATGNQNGQGSIGAAPKIGGAMTQLATTQQFPTAIAVQAGEVYWVNRANNPGQGSANRVPAGGGATTQIATGLYLPIAIALDDTYAYWCSADRVSRVPLGGGPIDVLVTGLSQPQGVAVNATDAYFTVGAEVRRLDLATKTMSSFAAGQAATAIALDADAVYWLDTGADQVMRAPLAGGPPVSLAALPPGAGIPAGSGIAVSATDVYFAFSTGGVVELAKVPLAGTQAAPVFLAQNGNVRGIAVDAQHVYWASTNSIRKVLR